MSTLGNWRGPNIVKEGLLVYLDAGSPNSFYLPLSDGNWKDISGNGNSGLLTNGPSFSTANGGSFYFDGINDYWNLSSALSTMNTIDIWVNMASTSNCPIVYYGSNAFDSNLWTWGIAVFPSGTHGFNAFPDNYPTSLLYTESVSVGTWKNFTLVRNDNGDTKLYKNGSLAGTYVGVGTTSLRDSGDRLYIGKSGSTYGNFYLSGLKIYNRSLNSTEILQNYNALKSRFGL